MQSSERQDEEADHEEPLEEVVGLQQQVADEERQDEVVGLEVRLRQCVCIGLADPDPVPRAGGDVYEDQEEGHEHDDVRHEHQAH